jgi:hypothetical protein
MPNTSRLLLCGSVCADRACRRFEEEREKVPFWPDIVHAWLGKLIWVAFIAQCFLGVLERAKEMAAPDQAVPQLLASRSICLLHCDTHILIGRCAFR